MLILVLVILGPVVVGTLLFTYQTDDVSHAAMMGEKFSFSVSSLYARLREWWKRGKREHQVRLIYAVPILLLTYTLVICMWLVYKAG